MPLTRKKKGGQVWFKSAKSVKKARGTLTKTQTKEVKKIAIKAANNARAKGVKSFYMGIYFSDGRVSNTLILTNNWVINFIKVYELSLFDEDIYVGDIIGKRIFYEVWI